MNRRCLLVIQSADNFGFGVDHDCGDIDFPGTVRIDEAGNGICVEVLDIYSWLSEFSKFDSLAEIYKIISITFLD